MEVQDKMTEVEKLANEQTIRLERITGMSRDDARKFLIENMVNEAKSEGMQLVKDVRDEAKLWLIRKHSVLSFRRYSVLHPITRWRQLSRLSTSQARK